VWHCAVKSLGTVAVPDEWSIVLVLYCSRIVAACLHTMHALNALPTRTSCKRCQAPWKLVHVHWEHTYPAAWAGLPGFSLCLRHVAHREPRDTWQYQSPPQLGGKVRSHRTRGSTEAHLSREVRSRGIGHMAAPEPTSAER
jgi:hypothetical protein